jgi:hypothetical protein
MEAGLLKTLMPLIEKILDKILDKLFNSANEYSNSKKGPDDLKKLLEGLNETIKDPDFLAMMQRYDPNFSISGDIDTAKEIRDVKDVLLKAINDPETSTQDRIKLELIINNLNEAAAKIGTQGAGGEDNLQLTSSETIASGILNGRTTGQLVQQLVPGMNGGAMTTPSTSGSPTSHSGIG